MYNTLMPSQKPHYKHLRDKWTKRHRQLHQTLWNKHKDSLAWLANKSKQLAIGSSLGGLLIFGLPQAQRFSTLDSLPFNEQVTQDIDKNVFLISDLSNVLPSTVRPLTQEEEQKVSEIIFRSFGIRTRSVLNGKRLNRSYGLIGQEQHLARYPGDNMYSHFNIQEEAKQFWSFGMAPGLGAWGYFAPSKDQLTEKDKLREKYYIAVQTFSSPGFNEHVAEYRDFFKYRKMLVVNPNNGKAMVTVIGDSGPAEYTGKHLGGSPEVMRYLERVDGSLKGPVIYFFIDDPNDTIPLGPIALS